MRKNRHAKQKHYVRLSLVERKEIQESLNKKATCSLHALADALQRSCSTVHDEVKRNRSYAKGSRKGQVVEELPEDVCEKLNRWPFVCNGCRHFHYHCSKHLQLEYRASIADRHAHILLTAAREGIDRIREDFEYIGSCTISRGLSPEQIISTYALSVVPSTLSIGG